MRVKIVTNSPVTRPTGFLTALFMAVLLCPATLQAGQLLINGVSDELAENIELVAGGFPRDDRLIDVYIEVLPEQTKKALAAYGYFEPEIDIKRNVVDEEQIVTLNINIGSPVLISSIDVEVNGEAEADPEFQEILQRLPLKKNDVFLSPVYETTKSLLLDAAQAKGYFDFKFVTNKVLVSRISRTAVINLVADSGPRFTFGQIRFDQDVFSDTFLNRWVPFEPNEPYDTNKITEFTQNLQNSGYFSTVRVSPQRDIRYGPTVPILVSLEQKDSNQVGLGLGYSSDERFRGRLTWGKPVINRRGHSANVELSLSRINQSASFAYRIPRSTEPLYNYWGVEYGLKRSDIDGVQSLLSTLNFQRVRRFGNQWTESLFIRWERESFTISDESDISNLVLPGVRYSRSRSAGSPFLYWGQSSSFQLMYGDTKALSTIDFFKATVNFKYLRAVSSRNTFIFSFQYGAIDTNDFDEVPATQRFFAGGDRSIRGFEYRSVSPVDEEGNTTGGRYLEVGSIEYNYRYADRWSVALFADVGRAFNSFGEDRRVGAGIGVRWQSPVGPFRLDLAHPVNDDESNGIQLHLSLGPDL